MFRQFSKRNMAPEGDGQGTAAAGTATPEPQQQTQSDGQDFSGKDHMAARITKLVKQNEALEKRLADRDAAEKAAAEAAELKKLEEQNNYQEALKRLQEKNASIEATFKARERQLQLEAGFAGITGDDADVIVAGLISKCPTDKEPSDYIAEVREKRAALWQPQSAQQRIGAQGVPSSGSQTGMSLEERLKFRDEKDPHRAARIRLEARAEKAKAGGYD